MHFAPIGVNPDWKRERQAKDTESRISHIDHVENNLRHLRTHAHRVLGHTWLPAVVADVFAIAIGIAAFDQ